MARNIEIKARVNHRDQIEDLAKALADEGPVVLVQTDTFFNTGQGRLKLRQFPKGHGELIAYQRPDMTGPSASNYSIFRTDTPHDLYRVLADANGILGEVREIRTLYLKGITRIHLDKVEGLGDFIELEAVLSDTVSAADGEFQVRSLMKQLEIQESDLINCAYLDLLMKRNDADTQN